MRKLMVLLALAAWLSFAPQMKVALAEEMSGTIESIDEANQKVTVGGEEFTVESDALEQLKEVQVGDKVRVTYSPGSDGGDKFVEFINKE